MNGPAAQHPQATRDVGPSLTRLHFAACALAALVVLLTFSGEPAFGATRLDPSFGTGGVARADTDDYELAGEMRAWGLDRRGGIVGVGIGALRFDGSGAFDPGFSDRGSDPLAEADAIAFQPDGKFLAAGKLYTGIKNLFTLVRYEPDGDIDRGFGTNGTAHIRMQGINANVLAVEVTRSGRILCAGTIRNKGGKSFGVLFSLKPNGKLDRGFGRQGKVEFRAGQENFTGLSDLEILPSGKILVSGILEGRFLLARLRPNGTFDRRFGRAGRTVKSLGGCDCGYLTRIEVGRDGKVVMLTGYRFGNPYMGLARFTARGRLDPSFRGRGYFHTEPPITGPGGGPVRRPTDLTLRHNGNIVMSARAFTDERVFLVGQFRPDGRPDQGFFGDGMFIRDFGVDSAAQSVMVQGRKLIAAGSTAGGVVLVRFRG